MFQKYIPSLICASLSVAVYSCVAMSADPQSTLQENEVSIQSIKAVFDAASYKTQLLQNEILTIETKERNYLLLLTERIGTKVIQLNGIYRLKEKAPEIEKLRLVNDLNMNIGFATFSMPKPDRLYCMHDIAYDGGIEPSFLIREFRRYAEAAATGVIGGDPDNLIDP